MENTKNNTVAKAAEQSAVYGVGTVTPQPIVKGDNLMLFDSNKKSIAYATSHTLSLSLDVQDISSKDHAEFGASEGGKITWEISAEHLMSAQSYDTLFSQMIAKTPLTVYFGTKMNVTGTPADGDIENWTLNQSSTSIVYTGKVLITSLELSAQTGEKATFSVTLTGVGEIKKASN